MEEYSQLFGEKSSNDGESQAPSIPRIAVGTGMIHVNHELTEESLRIYGHDLQGNGVAT